MRVERSFAFVDLSGFTSFTDAHGDEEAGRVLAEFRTAVRTVTSRRGVRVAKWQGDGAMFVSVTPAPLVEAVLEIEHRIDENESPLRLRGGMTTGKVILFEGDDYIGSAVNLAARLSDVAAPHEILATTDLAVHAPEWATVEPAGEVEVRGFAHPISVVRVFRRADEGSGVQDPICGMVLPSDGVVVRRTDEHGHEVGFCSDSCADTYFPS